MFGCESSALVYNGRRPEQLVGPHPLLEYMYPMSQTNSSLARQPVLCSQPAGVQVCTVKNR